MAAALQRSAAAAPRPPSSAGGDYAAAAAVPPPAAAAGLAAPPRAPALGGGIFASLFPGQRPPSMGGATPAAAVPPGVSPRAPSPCAGAPRPYRPPAMGGYRRPQGGGYRPPGVGAPPPAPAAAAAPVAAAAPAAAAPAQHAPAAAASSPPGAPAAPLKNPCVQCKERESVHIWIPCGHHGHCQGAQGLVLALLAWLAGACRTCSQSVTLPASQPASQLHAKLCSSCLTTSTPLPPCPSPYPLLCSLPGGQHASLREAAEVSHLPGLQEQGCILHPSLLLGLH